MHWLRALTLCTVLSVSVLGDRPNYVFFLVDDLGWADLGCFGSTFHETPNIDRLCASGMKFTQAYAACPVCSPTRASIMTGRHPVRVGITDWIPGMRAKNPKLLAPEDRDELALEEITIAEALKGAGYQTFFAGKWHLGGTEAFWPERQGFDINIGGCSKGSPPGGYYAPWRNPRLKARHENEYLTERLTQESIHFLNHRGTESPFLLYLSYYNVHTPITPYRKRMSHYQNKVGQFSGVTPSRLEHEGRTRMHQDNAAYASMVAAVDASVGQLLDALTTLHLDENTVVFFFSDNGGLSTKRTPGPTCNLPLRAGKGWLYEGGIREPMIVRAPGWTKPGSSCSVPVVSMDFFPTILDLAGLDIEGHPPLDGRSLRPLLENTQPRPLRDLFWHYPHYHGSTWKPGAAVRTGDWKLIEFYHDEKVELYHLGEDPGEHRDQSRGAAADNSGPASPAAGLAAKQAQMPRSNPEYRPEP